MEKKERRKKKGEKMVWWGGVGISHTMVSMVMFIFCCFKKFFECFQFQVCFCCSASSESLKYI